MRACGAVLLSLTLATANAAAAPEPVAVSLSRSGAIRVPVSVDGAGPFEFLLDTGSTHSVVAVELAERLSLPVVARTRVLTPAGPHEALVVRVGQISVGSVGVDGLMPSVVTLAQLRETEPGIDGVIGQDFLSAFDFTIDYRRKVLAWAVEDGDGQVRVPLVARGERRLVQLPGGEGRPPVVLVPDTGAEAFVIFERGGKTAVETRDASGAAVVSGLASRQLARAAFVRELRIGSVTVRNEPAVVVSRNDGSSAVEGDGLLPLHRFSSVAFDNSRGFLVVRR